MLSFPKIENSIGSVFVESLSYRPKSFTNLYNLENQIYVLGKLIIHLKF